MNYQRGNFQDFGSLGKAYSAALPACVRLCVLSSIVLSLLGLILVPFRDEILNAIAGWFLPADWLASFHMANEALFHQIGSVLLFQTVAIACFTAISLFFFPLRDRISILTETQLTGQCARGPGLRRELWLEAGLVLIAFNVYSMVYLLAYFVGQPLFAFIDELAFLLLTLFFVLDLLSPAYLRRNKSCLHVFKALLKHPLPLLLFGVIFCSPIFALELVFGDLLYQQDNLLLLGVALVCIIVLNCIVCTFALPMGTWLALQALPPEPAAQVDQRVVHRHVMFFGAQAAVMLALLLLYGSVVSVLLNKVPLKSADYEIQWMTLDYQQGLAGGPPSLHFDMRIYNRHQSLGLEVDSAILLLNLDGRYLGEAGLNIPYVAPNTAINVPIELKLRVDFSEFAGIAFGEFLSFFSGESAGWRDQIQARLQVQLPLGLQFPIYITEGYRHEFKLE